MAGPAYHGRTHLPGGTDPIPGLTLAAEDTTGPGLEDLILSRNAVGVWKLDETTGTTATDSSGNANHMTVPPGGFRAPTWAQTAGPPGTTSAQFLPWASGALLASRVNVALTAITDDFSAGVWWRVPTGNLGLSGVMLGQGLWQNANSWTIWLDGGTSKVNVSMGATNIAANNAASVDTWYLVGFSRVAGTTTIYIDGLAQTATTATGPGTSATDTWIGSSNQTIASSSDSNNYLMSWAFITDTPLSGSDWTAAYESGVSPGVIPAGWVWTSNGAGGASWQPLP